MEAGLDHAAEEAMCLAQADERVAGEVVTGVRIGVPTVTLSPSAIAGSWETTRICGVLRISSVGGCKPRILGLFSPKCHCRGYACLSMARSRTISESVLQSREET